jgi:hypothetical protein
VTAFGTINPGSQGSLILNDDETRLFAVDAGSNQISVVKVLDGHLSLAGVFPSGGAGPVRQKHPDLCFSTASIWVFLLLMRVATV